MITHESTVYIATELGTARRVFDEALEHFRAREFVLARQRLRGTANRLSRMANLIESNDQATLEVVQ